jgi:hypothetical protein
MNSEKEVHIKKYSINGNNYGHLLVNKGSLLTILQNKLASSERDSDVLLFG